MADEMKAPVDYDPDNYDPEKLLNDPNWKQPGPESRIRWQTACCFPPTGQA